MTFFAPTNEAIRKMKETVEKRRDMDSRDRKHVMDEIIRYHIVSEELGCEDFFDGMTIKTDLKLRELDNNHQRIRVLEMWNGDVMLVGFFLCVRGRLTFNRTCTPVSRNSISRLKTAWSTSWTTSSCPRYF